MKSKSQTVNLTIPTELLKKVDALAKRNYTSRSDILRQSLLKAVRQSQKLDEWGEEGNWETLVDFREIAPSGVPAEDVVKAMRELLSE